MFGVPNESNINLYVNINLVNEENCHENSNPPNVWVPRIDPRLTIVN